MAVTLDIGNPDDVHPLNKQDVASRLARIARAKTYGQNVEYSGPVLRQAIRDGSTVRIWFDHANGGLRARGSGLNAFEVAGSDGKFFQADAKIDAESIVLTSKNVLQPTHVRFAWRNDPPCCIWNKEGLPASPFSAPLQ
jgi:sialate O-acetylesterase